MSADWKELTLADIAEHERGLVDGPFGSNLPASCYVEEGVPVIRGSNLTVGLERFKPNNYVYVSTQTLERIKRSMCLPNDVVFTKKGTLGQTGLVPSDSRYNRYLLSSNQMRLRVNTNLADPEYVYYWVSSKASVAKIKRDSEFTGVPKINLQYLKKFPILIPKLTVQKKISKILSGFDKKIELHRQINQNLEAMAQTIFKSWFVDFEPVKAKIAAIEAGEDTEGITRAAMRAISGKTDDELDKMGGRQAENYAQLKSTAGLFPSAMQESELGEVPEGWDVSNFGKVSTCFDKNRIPLSKRQREQKQGLIPYYGATSVMDYVNDSIFDGIYLLLGEDGSVLKDNGTPFIQYIWGKSWVNNHAHVLQGANGVSTEHLMLFMQSQNITAYVTGAVQLKLNQKNMNSIPFINAGKPINDAFYRSIAPLYEFKRNAKEEIEELSNLHDILLPKLLSGELSVDAIKVTSEQGE